VELNDTINLHLFTLDISEDFLMSTKAMIF